MAISGDARRRYNQTYYRTVTKPRRVSQQASDRKLVVTFRLAESLVARCVRLKDEALSLGRYPWRSMGEVYRGLIIKGLESMKGDPVIDEMLPYLKILKHVEGLAHPRKEAEATLSSAATEVARLLEIGAKAEAVQFFSTTMELTQDMAPTIWREWLIEQLNKTFPQLKDAAPRGVSATNGMKRKKQARR